MTKAERRREPRSPARGIVDLRLEDPVRVEIRGQLVDTSDGGFRANHSYAGLQPGQEVDFRHPTAAGRARVAWNRILDERVESGFVIV